MIGTNVAWNFNAILTQLVVQQAAPANNPARFFAKAFDSNNETVRAKETYVRGRSREPPATSRVGIIHDARNKRGVLQQAEAAPLQRCARPLMPVFHLSLFTFHVRPNTALSTPGAPADPEPS